MDTQESHVAKAIQVLANQSASLTEAYLKDPSNNIARIRARTAARNLHLGLQNGDDAFFFMLEQAYGASVIRFFMHISALDAIPFSGSISATALAQKLDCEVDFIVRMMRMVVAAGLFSEPERDCYAHTARSVDFLDPGYASLFQVMMDDFVAGGTWPSLQQYYKVNALKSPDDPRHHPYGCAFDMDGKDWHEVVARTPALLERFSLAMTGRWSFAPVTGVFPFESIQASSTGTEDDGDVLIVDIGGRDGNTLQKIQDAHPQLKGKMIVQDLPQVIATIPMGSLPSSIEPMAHDFMEPQPVKNAKIYYIRRVLHDWSDPVCVQILRRQADAMSEDSVLLVAELVIPDRVQRDDTFMYTLDLTLFMLSGRERSAEDFARLFDESGLELVKVWRKEGTYQGVVEARKKKVV